MLDLDLPDTQVLGAVRRAHTTAPHIPLVVLTDLDDETLAAQVLQAGAQDYLIKGQIDARGLLRSLHYSIERKGIERKNMEEALFVATERAQVTLSCIGDAVACTDIEGNVAYLNLAAEKMTGWSLAEAADRPLAEVLRIMDAISRRIAPHPLERAADANRTPHLSFNSILIGRDGSETRSRILLL